MGSSCKRRGNHNENLEYSGNPIIPGWYADPEGIIFDDEYWVYPTYSDHYEFPDTSTGLSEEQLAAQKNAINKQYLIQTFFDAFSSKDLIEWKKHSHVLDIIDIEWASYSLWAPSIIRANNKYYLFFSANDIQSNEELGGIGVAVSDDPAGPFVDALGKPLINEFYNDAQPIDQFVFRDDDGQHYMYYGGWRHCNVVKLCSDLLSLELFEDGERFKEITPEDYVEGPFVLKRNNKYYLMWSEGGWGGPHYRVAYAIGDSPVGDREWKGYIGEVRLYSRALSVSELKIIANCGGLDGIAYKLEHRWVLRGQEGQMASGSNSIKDLAGSAHGTPSGPVFSSDTLSVFRGVS